MNKSKISYFFYKKLNKTASKKITLKRFFSSNATCLV